MIWHRKAKPWTKREQARADRMAEEIGCIFCALADIKAGCDHRHHVKSGNKRMGHWYTLPLCERHHGYCHDGTIRHSVQIQAWFKVQHILGLSDELPPSKIFKRVGKGADVTMADAEPVRRPDPVLSEAERSEL